MNKYNRWLLANGYGHLVQVPKKPKESKRRKRKSKQEREAIHEKFLNTLDRSKMTRDWYRNQYLKSNHWRGMRKQKLQQMPCCEICGKDKIPLDVHHKNYRMIYDVKLSDLMTLCRACHNRLHYYKNTTVHT